MGKYDSNAESLIDWWLWLIWCPNLQRCKSPLPKFHDDSLMMKCSWDFYFRRGLFSKMASSPFIVCLKTNPVWERRSTVLHLAVERFPQTVERDRSPAMFWTPRLHLTGGLQLQTFERVGITRATMSFLDVDTCTVHGWSSVSDGRPWVTRALLTVVVK